MSIPVLQQVYEETRRLSIAGSGLANGDFRLKKLIEPLEKSAAKAPVFGKVAESIKKLIDSKPDESASSLLELNSLTSAILYTQGETGCEGELSPIETKDFGLSSSQTSARLLKPLIEALTTTGSGRMEVIKNAYEQGLFKDLRLIKPAVRAIDDTYAEIGDFMAEHVLPMFGQAILDDLKEGYDQKGKGDDARRLRLMHKLDPEGTRPLVEKALEEGSKEVKVVAIECLGGVESSIPFLLEQAKARAADVRAAALRSLSSFGQSDVMEHLIKVISGPDVGMVTKNLKSRDHSKWRSLLLEEAGRRREELLSGKIKEKDKTKTQAAIDAKIEQLNQLFVSFDSDTDKEVVHFWKKIFNERDAWFKIEGLNQSGSHIVATSAEGLVTVGGKEGLNLVADAKDSLPQQLYNYALFAQVQSQTPKEVFNDLSPTYKNRPEGRTKEAKAAREKSEAISSVLQTVSGQTKYYSYRFWYGFGFRSFQLSLDGDAAVKIDPRWLDAAVELEDLDLVTSLVTRDHKKAIEALRSWLHEKRKDKKSHDYSLFGILERLIEVEAPNVTEEVIATIKFVEKSGKYFIANIARLIPHLPPEDLPKLEAILPELSADALDLVAGGIDELKQRSKEKGK